MKITLLYLSLLLLICTSSPLSLHGNDWPIFKGNIYFTGNNDEIIVKNNNLKWLFQGNDRIYNPVVSDSKVFFTDRKGNVYCLDEEYGKLIWKINLIKISKQFKALSRSAGKIKYPLIKGNTLFLSDPIAIYAIDKHTGRILWARTGMRQSNKTMDISGRMSRPMVDGIYSDPIILNDNIYYGTREMFISREIRNGHINWNNNTIKTYSGYPTFYDDLIFTQSMDYSSGKYTVHCLNSFNGKEKWSQRILKPIKIFPPVIYKQKVFIPSNKSIYCINIKTGEKIWSKEYENFITSNPSFTDRSILFSIGNSDIIVIDPHNGNIIKKIKISPKSSPCYVTVRNQLYIAYNKYSTVKKRRIPYGYIKALNFSNDSTIWQYKTPFPGAVSQPISSKGILFLPAGNYLYAIGTEYYTRVVEGGSGHAVTPGQEKGKQIKPPQPRIPEDKPEKIETRKLKLIITDRDKRIVPAVVEIKKREKGKIKYCKRTDVPKKDIINVPKGDGVDLIVIADNFIPKKVLVKKDDIEKHIILDRIQTGKPITIDNIFFEINQAYLKKESIDILDMLIKVMNQKPKLKVEIRGHTDSTGEEAYNQKLSERRADAVSEYMIKNGISPERLNSIGFGERKPIATNKTEKGRGKNRRTEFFFRD